MLMRNILIIIIVFYFVSYEGNAQLWKLKRIELSAEIGTTQYYGDIGGYSQGENAFGLKDFTFQNTGINIGTSLKYRILDDLSGRINLAFGSFHSTDSEGSNESRGFESSTLFFEPSIIGEYYFIRNAGDNSYSLLKGKGGTLNSFFSMLDFYAFAGIGALAYKVKPNDELASQVTQSTGFTAVIPGGVGLNLVYSRNFSFGLELGFRYSFSDNVDGYSSSYSRSNDVYHFLDLTFTYKIKTGQKGMKGF
jgi:hypothetical protein